MGTASRAFVLGCCSLLLLVPAWTVGPVDTLDELQRKFDREMDGVNKAKMLRRLGDAQFDREREAAKAGEYETAALVMEKYRDNVRAALEALKKQHPNAEKQPNGYRQLEIHARKGIREIGESLLVAPEPFKPPLEIVREDLAAMDDELLKLLFPNRPLNQKAKNPPPPGKQP